LAGYFLTNVTDMQSGAYFTLREAQVSTELSTASVDYYDGRETASGSPKLPGAPRSVKARRHA
jgi:hypothetical protein